jgi:uncharacterized protein YrzB (UPF0473 family)
MNTPEERDDVIILTDEEGQEYEFQLIDVIEVDELRYAVLFPLNEDESSEDEALIMRLEADEETGEDLLVDIEDDDEWEKVVAEWERLLEEEEADEEDEDEE